MKKGAIQAANQAKKEQIIHAVQNHKIGMKSDRKRMQNEEEMERQAKLITEAVKTGNCMVFDLAFDTNTTKVGEFMAMVSTQREQKKNLGKEKEEV